MFIFCSLFSIFDTKIPLPSTLIQLVSADHFQLIIDVFLYCQLQHSQKFAGQSDGNESNRISAKNILNPQIGCNQKQRELLLIIDKPLQTRKLVGILRETLNKNDKVSFLVERALQA